MNFGQNKVNSEKFKELEPAVWLNIWDKVNSDNSLKIDIISYDEIPKSLDFRGTVVKALKWNDSLGGSILIQTVSGKFNWKYCDENSTSFVLQDKSELLYVYLEKIILKQHSLVFGNYLILINVLV